MRISQKDFKALEAKRLAKKPKYNNTKVLIDNILFDSKKEGARYSELKLMEKAGLISSLVLQPKFELKVNGFKVATYIADFCYNDFRGKGSGDFISVTEDVKGVKTPVYNLKKKLMKAIYGIEIQEI